ncbi:MAG: Rrf2 family transcriptional regulator [Planctomycetota bacterium]|nr:Rrf2 family transcriptional regulator [Planctomycetota bacterium]
MAKSKPGRARRRGAERAERGEMHLSATAEYALRAMTHLASLPPGSSARAADLEAVTGTSAPYLAKVLRRLVVAGLLDSRKGHHGGFALARPPAEVRFADILQAVGHSPDPTRCAFGWGECDPDAPCPLHDAWSQLTASFRDWATTTTLAGVGPAAPAGRRLPRARGPRP